MEVNEGDVKQSEKGSTFYSRGQAYDVIVMYSKVKPKYTVNVDLLTEKQMTSMSRHVHLEKHSQLAP